MATDCLSKRDLAFAGNPLIGAASTATKSSQTVESATASLHNLFQNIAQDQDAVYHKILPFEQGKPLVLSKNPDDVTVAKDDVAIAKDDVTPIWQLAWQSLDKCRELFRSLDLELGEEAPLYLGQRDGVVYWALDFIETGQQQQQSTWDGICAYVDLKTLMAAAADWSDDNAMAELSIAGHARAMLVWHGLSQFCGKCGTRTLSMEEAGRRRQCQNSVCKKRIYPRIDPAVIMLVIDKANDYALLSRRHNRFSPQMWSCLAGFTEVVIMLVIDKANDCALLSRQSRFPPRMWSCLAGFIEPGESLEEAVRRETWEEVGIEVGEVIYHSSQPWPVGPSSMPCQLMVGFFAYAKSFNIHVDRKELEDARWYCREDVKKALTFAEYKKAQRTSAFKVHGICDGVERAPGFSADFNVETGDLSPMFIPSPVAIAHHLISSWANECVDVKGS